MYIVGKEVHASYSVDNVKYRNTNSESNSITRQQTQNMAVVNTETVIKIHVCHHYRYPQVIVHVYKYDLHNKN